MNKLLAGGSIALLVLAIILVTLGVSGFFTNPTVETIADDIVKAKTGIDLEKVEENLLNKK